MLNVFRITTNVIKKFQLADLTKILSCRASKRVQIIFCEQQPQPQILQAEKTENNNINNSQIQHHHHHQKNHSNYTNNNNQFTTTQPPPGTSSAAVASTTINCVSGGKSSSSAEPTFSIFETVKLSSGEENIRKKINLVRMSNNELGANITCNGNVATTICNNHHSQAEDLKKDHKMEASAASASSSAGEPCSASSLADTIKFLELVGSLKHMKRTGWVMRNVDDCESISGHMYRMSMMSFLLEGQQELNRTKCMELALIHDLAECLVGDITPFCGVSREEKRRREMQAMEEICKLVQPQGKKILELFVEYETAESPESKFVKDLDRLDMVLQAFEYEKRDNCIMKHQEFFDSTDGKFEHPYVKKLITEINNQRKVLAEERTNGSSTPTQNGYSDNNHHHNHHQQNGHIVVGDIPEQERSSS